MTKTVEIRPLSPTGCIGVLTDAKPGAITFYDQMGFTQVGGVREGRLHGDATPMFLSIQDLAAANPR